jgi:SNF2 family DNA or RNA helicase
MSRFFGDIQYCDSVDNYCCEAFAITAEPHVMIKLKAIFGRINKSQYATVKVRITPDVCRDLEWFLDRYPLKMDPKSEQKIRNGSKEYRQTLECLEKIVMPGYQLQTFDLALPLRHYQAQAVEIHLRTGALLVADQMGLGKTVTAIGSFTQKKTLPALVVCQTHLVEQWREFIARFMPAAKVHIVKTRKIYDLPSADVYVCTYTKLSGWANVWKDPFLKSIVFDEIQELRHSNSDKYQAAAAIRKSCDFAMGLSGTPIFNLGGEIWNVMDILAPGRLGSCHEFYREWCNSYGQKMMLTDPVAFGAFLREQFLMVRRTREDVGLELPASQKIVQTIPYDTHILDKITNHALELAKLIMTGEFTQRGQAAREFDILMRQQTGISKAPFVAEFVRMILEEGEPVLLFGWHRAVYDIWVEQLKDFNPVLFTGSESPAQKEQAKEAFVTGKSNLMIMSLRSGSGVDGLQLRCKTAVFGELDWSPAVHSQCSARLDRDGVNRGLSFYYLVADGGSDPPMAEVLGLKTAQIQGLLNDKVDPVLHQVDTERLKHMAEQFLRKHSPKNPVVSMQAEMNFVA